MLDLQNKLTHGTNPMYLHRAELDYDAWYLSTLNRTWPRNDIP